VVSPLGAVPVVRLFEERSRAHPGIRTRVNATMINRLCHAELRRLRLKLASIAHILVSAYPADLLAGTRVAI
jgi:hypothetical protein